MCERVLITVEGRTRRLQLRQAGDEGLHRDRQTARGAVQVRHRRFERSEVRPIRTGGYRVPDDDPVSANYHGW